VMDGCLFSPDGRFLAYGCSDGRIHLDVAATGESFWRSEPLESWAMDIAFAADQPRMAAALESHQIHVWTIGERQLRLEAVFETPSDEHPPAQIVLTRDGSKLLSADQDEHGIRVWDVASARHERMLDTRFGSRLVALSPDEKLVATGHDFVYVWEFATGRELLTVKDGDFITSLVFTHDSRVLVTGHRDGSIRARQMPSGRLLHLMTGHNRDVQAMTVTQDGKTLVTADRGGVVRLWSLETGEEFGVLHRVQAPKVYVESISINTVTSCLAFEICSEDPRQDVLLMESDGWRPESTEPTLRH